MGLAEPVNLRVYTFIIFVKHLPMISSNIFSVLVSSLLSHGIPIIYDSLYYRLLKLVTPFQVEKVEQEREQTDNFYLRPVFLDSLSNLNLHSKAFIQCKLFVSTMVTTRYVPLAQGPHHLTEEGKRAHPKPNLP